MKQQISFALAALLLTTGALLVASEPSNTGATSGSGYDLLVRFAPDYVGFCPESVTVRTEDLAFELDKDPCFNEAIELASKRMRELDVVVSRRADQEHRATLAQRQREVSAAKRQRRLKYQLAWSLKK
ncbi:hypothetical protein JST99_01425 [Candidatus Dependentiae bacterium]|nr:hypothetical protein [Candidatus Dependentiae bacterium]